MKRADILVNSANPDLKQPTACGEALRKRGGPSFVQACSCFSSLSKGNVVTTHGGNLDCNSVLHAVCCKWDNGRGNSEKTLRYLVRSILDTAVQLGASTVAMPAIGTREHEFPETVVLRVLREEIEKFSCCKPFTKLKEIQIVVSAEETACQSSAVGFRTISFGSVNVSLHQGDITQHPVDAMINVLPGDLKLANGGGLCKSILRAGGQDIQRKLKVLPGKPCRGSVVLTDAGSMSNIQNILHFLPTSTDNHGLRKSIEQCFLKAKSYSLTSVSIAAIGTGPFNISPRDSADIILGAAKEFSKAADYPLDVDIVVKQKRLIPSFETSIQEKTRENMGLKTPSPTKSIPDQKSGRICLRSSKSRVEGSVTLHFFAHLQQDIEISVEEVKKFVEVHTETRTIEIEKVCHLLMKNYSEVEDLENVHDVSITCQPPSQVAISGLKSTVQACEADLLSLIEKHGGKHQIFEKFLRISHFDTLTSSQEIAEELVGSEEAFHHEESSTEDGCYIQESFETNQLLSEASNSVPDYSADSRTLLPLLPIEEMSKAVSTKWPRLARLLDVPESIGCGTQYPDHYVRAREVIELFLNLHHAGELSASATNELVNCFNEIRVKLPEGLLPSYSGTPLQSSMLSGELTLNQRPTFLSSAHSAGTSMLDGSPEFLQINAAKQEGVSDSTPLSQREIERLSREIPATWRQLAGLLELPPDDVKNVERNPQYFDETDKAVKVLQLYNDAPSFNRSELGDFLEELRHSGLKDLIVNGTLRKKHYTQS